MYSASSSSSAGGMQSILSEESNISARTTPPKRKYKAVTVEDANNDSDYYPSKSSAPRPPKKQVLPSTPGTVPRGGIASSPIIKEPTPKSPSPPRFRTPSTPSRATTSTSSQAYGTSSRKGRLMPRAPARRRSSHHEEDRDFLPDSDDEENGFWEIPDNEKATVVFDYDRERDRRYAHVLNIPEGMYTRKEKELFLKLAMRGFEPLAPKHWQFDFPTLPDSLFPEEGKEQAEPIIQISRSTTFYAIKSLNNLFSLSGRVRDCSVVKKDPENIIKQNIMKYIRWALYDVNLDVNRASMPIHVLHAKKPSEEMIDALERVNNRLKKLAARHRKALAAAPGANNDELPLLIGFLATGPILAVLTYDLSLMSGTSEDDELDAKFFAEIDFSERGQDVWNSLSVAITVMHIRNTMARLARNGYGGYARTPTIISGNEDL
ncbi:uncharacterized protein DSM5745_10073 [Aspergillus mulundensis]|uniref:Uncharacterized protein n=1 Tax=Aspergillus mulundensis TaxID=1810919 RepID=A0A3D8QMD6_9EURO|nr:Uncharacterized protein DSM5745_10073 [Aspergillus mulundensis]RDW62962.1 Uncharacterized protein DSM5745_10073 [Aspergillus mulundensis]